MPSPAPRWRTDHKPNARPRGCNGKYGASGRKAHTRKGEPICQKCRDSETHYARERRRGQPHPRRLHPCGTPAAARRHRKRKERLDLACATAEAKAHAEYRARQEKAAPTVTMAYIRARYGVPAKRGARVRYTGSPGNTYDGTITGTRGAHLRIRFDGAPMGVDLVDAHPTWMLEYLEPPQ